MRNHSGSDYKERAERLLKAIEKVADRKTKQRLENEASTCLTVVELIGWGNKNADHKARS